MNKPAWWPQNPYPTDIFPMERSEYPKIVPDPNVRGALSGCLGRVFWDIASNMIWDAMRKAQADAGEPGDNLFTGEGMCSHGVLKGEYCDDCEIFKAGGKNWAEPQEGKE